MRTQTAPLFNVPRGRRGTTTRVVHPYPCGTSRAGNRTRVVAWGVQSANHYTTGPARLRINVLSLPLSLSLSPSLSFSVAVCLNLYFFLSLYICHFEYLPLITILSMMFFSLPSHFQLQSGELEHTVYDVK